MNAGRAKMQSDLRKGVEEQKLEEARKRWSDTSKKIMGHKRSVKPYSNEKEEI